MATDMLCAGFAKREVTLTGPLHLAGYFTLRPRISAGVRDPLFARAVALEQGSLRVVVLVLDALVVTVEMAKALHEALADTGAAVMAIATHTHSAPGGYWAPLAARLGMGPFVEGRLEQWVAAGAAAARQALEDLRPARWATQIGAAPEAAVNRRDVRLPADAHVWSLLLEREHDAGILCGASAHPVIVAERAHHLTSADFPGTIIQELERRVGFAAFVNGSLAGGGTVLPPGSVDDALSAQARPIIDQVMRVLAAPRNNDGVLAFVSRELLLPPSPAPRAAFDDQPIGRWATRPLDAMAKRLFSDARPVSATLQAICLGHAALIGLPTEPGFDLSLSLRESAEQLGFSAAFVAAHANGYIGYVLRRDGYRTAPARHTLAMATYENLMNVFGPDFGERLLVEGRRLLEALGRQVSPAERYRVAAGS
jgi:neutral ceramidase